MRAKFSAASWISSTIRPVFRLSFADFAASDLTTAQWGVPIPIPSPTGSLASAYMRRLTAAGTPAELVAQLAQAGDPLRFSKEDRGKALGIISATGRSGPAAPTAARILTSCAEALDQRNVPRLERALADLLFATTHHPPTDADRADLLALVEHHRLLAESPLLPHLTERLL